jgi:pyruvate/2-oxoglutarate dehydrogenase complex dihydrolipoamide acyltransferase (E2) component
MNSIAMKSSVSIAPELWATSILPEGILERWILAEGSQIEAGDPVAVVRIESAQHDILAPARGTLHIQCAANQVIEPGTVIGYICREVHGAKTAAPSNDPARKSARA